MTQAELDAVPAGALVDVDGIVEAAAREGIRTFGELGLQVSAVVDGQPIVDVAAGWADIARQRPVDSDSLFPLFSATKGVVAAACAELLESGALSLDEPIAKLWPEFAVAGKSRVSLRHVLTHTAGLPQMPPDTTVEQMCDWDHMVRALAAMAPMWEPGSRVGYHAYTYGWLAGQALKLAAGTGEDVATLVRRLACEPAGATDFWLGIPADVEDRVVSLVAMEVAAPRQDMGLFRLAIPAHLDTSPEVYGRSDVRQACLPGAGGIGTAAAMARIYGRLAVLDHRSWARRAGQVWEQRTDTVTGRAVARGLGFWVSGSTEAPLGPPLDGGPGRFGHPGAGGSIAWADADLGAGFAITRSRMTALGWNDPSIVALVEAAYSAVRRHRCGGA
jgi:CubicO group peptidase (beta-lactamase class C family)